MEIKMTQSRLTHGRWIKARKSNDPRDNCVEVMLTDKINVRDSKNPAASFSTTAAGWQALLDSVRK